MNIKRFESYNDVRLDTQYELRLLDKFGEELEYDYDDDDKNFNPFSLEDTVKLYMKYEKKHKP